MPPSGVIIASKKSAREARSTIGRASDAYRIKFGAYEIVCRHWLAHISLPDNRTVASIQRVHVIRFRRDNDHRFAIGAALDVKRLSVNVANNCAVEVQVAPQIGGCALGECRINVKTVTRFVVVKLRNIDLRASLHHCVQEHGKE